jgi:putative oxidoreductase
MLLESVAVRVFVPILLRFALAAVFIYHGLGKVGPEANFGFSWGDKMPDPPPKVVQVLVAWGEVLGGAACALGILTRIAALGLAAIMVGAIVTVHGPHGFSMEHSGYEYNLVLIVVCLSLALLGAGTISLDRVIKVKMRGPAKY